MADAKIILTAEDRVTSVVHKAQASLGSLATSLQTLGAGAAVAGITALTTSLVRMVGAVDDLSEAAEGLGVTAVQLAELRAAGAQAGVGVEQIDKALTSLNLKISQAIGGNKEAVDFFKRLGIAFQEAGKARSTLVVFGEFADRFKTFEDNASKAALGAEAFGQKIGPKLAALLNQGSSGLQVYVGLTEDTVNASKRLQSQLDLLDVEWQKLKNTILGGVVPAINEYLEAARRVKPIDLFTKGGLGALNDARAANQRDAQAQFLKDLNDPAKQAQQSLANLLPKPQAPIAEDPAAKAAREKALADARKIGDEAAREFQKAGLDAYQREFEANSKRAAAALDQQNKALNDAADAAFEYRQESTKLREEQEKFKGSLAMGALDNWNKGMEQSKQIVEDLGLVFESAVSKILTGDDLSAKNFFKALAQDILQVIVKIKLMQPLMEQLKSSLSSTGTSAGGSLLGDLFKWLGAAGAKASGGPVSAGRPFLVGEQGPEFFIPSVNGTIVPNGGGMGVTVMQNISIDARSDIASIRQAMAIAKNAAVREVGDQLARRGALARV